MTTICPSCGRESAGDQRFCPWCHAFLGFDETAPFAPVEGPGAMAPGRPQPGPPHPAPPRPESGSADSRSAPSSDSTPPPTRQPTTGDPSGRPILRGEGEALHVQPGEHVETGVEVRTSGELVDEIHLTLTGSAATFGQVIPPTVHLYPGTAQTVTVRFAPDRGPVPRSGSHSWVLEATSPVHRGATRTLAGVVEVEQLVAGRAELKPVESQGRSRRFTHQLLLTNQGNAVWPAQVALGSRTPMELVGPNGPVAVEPGSTVEVPVSGRTKWHWIGAARSLGFDVRLGPDSPHPPLPPVLSGTRLQRALIPVWLLALVPVVIGLAIAAFAVFGDSQLKVPTVAGKSSTEAQSILQEAGFVVTTLPAADPDVEPGNAIGTEPPAGTPVDPGFPVTLKVSTGKVEGDIPVPSVVGSTEEEAREEIEDVGLTPVVKPTASADVDEGEVVRTDPAAGFRLPEGFEVVVFVSTGAPPVELPDLAGQPVGEARARLQQVGLKERVVTESSETVDKDVVIRTDPSEGMVRAGGTVVLVVSSGPVPPVVVPDVTGQSSDRARETLDDAELEAETVAVAHGTVPADTVIGSVPGASEEVSAGTAVIVWVSSGPSDDADGLIGLSADESPVSDYIAANGGDDTTFSPITLDNGAQLSFLADSRIVDSVTLGPSYDGTLPAGLDWEQTVDEFSTRLGVATSLGPTGPDSQPMGAWDVPFAPVVGIVAIFDPDSGHPQTITLVGDEG